MKNKSFVFSIMLLFVFSQIQAQTVTTNTQSTNNGFFYSFWNDNSQGSASMTLGAAGNYSTTWSNVGNFTAGKGWSVGKEDRVICFDGSFNGGSNGFLAVYGWTKNPLIEYYVCENHGSWTPPGNTSDIVQKGTYTCDGGTYTIYTATRTNQPSIIGTATFQQYWSVRTQTRSSGTVTFANHVAAWKAAGMNMGTTWDYQIMESEGYHSSGSSNITVSECTAAPTGPVVSITSPSTNASFVAPASSITINANATTSTGTISKVEFYNGTTLLGTDTSSPYSYVWTNVAAGSYTITAVATDNSSNKTTSTPITINVVNTFKIYKTPSPITIDGTVDAIWNNASVVAGSAAKVVNGTISNAADLSGNFKALWDNTNLYILANVSDETLKHDSQNIYDDDGVEVYIDINNDKATTYGANDVQYSFDWNNGTTIGSLPSGRSTTGITYSIAVVTGGYVVEASIPWSTLQGTPAINQLVGIDFMINDDDDGTARDGKLSWNAASDSSWTDPSKMGTGQLMDVLSCSTPAAPTVTTPVTYCQGATASALTATGTALKWYTVATGGTGSTTAPTPSTTTVGSTTYYVSQTISSCESARAAIIVTVNAIPAAPTVTSPVTYTQGATATALTATGTGLLWYTAATGGTGSGTIPIPSTSTVGTTNYYVSQTTNGCESQRALIALIVSNGTLQKVTLRAGWNLIGCPITGSTDIANALSSIWPHVETVKNFDGFWDVKNAPALNSLIKLDWGKGYLIKVDAACDLDWIVR